MSEPDRPAPKNIWLLGFADLTCLLLAFFVMVYATSDIGPSSWGRVKASLANALDGGRTEGAGFTERTEISRFARAGLDLDYLESILASRFATAPELAQAVLERRADGLAILFPQDLLFEAGRHALDETARVRVRSLAGYLRRVRNRIEVHGHAQPADAADAAEAWDLSIARAAALAEEMRRGGYEHAIVALGFAGGQFGDGPLDSSVERGRRMARRVEIVVRAEAW